jgi:hypothetical protein
MHLGFVPTRVVVVPWSNADHRLPVDLQSNALQGSLSTLLAYGVDAQGQFERGIVKT